MERWGNAMFVTPGVVVDGKLVNTPREEHGLELRGGRAIATALRISPR